MKDLKQRMLDLLNETAQHYNSNNRSTVDGHCTYLPSDPTKSEGCAIGRKLPETSKALIAEKMNLNGTGVSKLMEIVPLGDELDGLSVYFLSDLQAFHDNDAYWDDQGLSAGGREHFNWFVNRINNYWDDNGF